MFNNAHGYQVIQLLKPAMLSEPKNLTVARNLTAYVVINTEISTEQYEIIFISYTYNCWESCLT